MSMAAIVSVAALMTTDTLLKDGNRWLANGCRRVKWSVFVFSFLLRILILTIHLICSGKFRCV